MFNYLETTLGVFTFLYVIYLNKQYKTFDLWAGLKIFLLPVFLLISLPPIILFLEKELYDIAWFELEMNFILIQLVTLVIGTIYYSYLINKIIIHSEDSIILKFCFWILLTIAFLSSLSTYIIGLLFPGYPQKEILGLSTFILLLPMFIWNSYIAYLRIPYEEYPYFYFIPGKYHFNEDDYRGVVLQIEVIIYNTRKNWECHKIRLISSHAYSDMPLSDLFSIVLFEYNEKNQHNTITVCDSQGNPYPWVIFNDNVALDWGKKLDENGIHPSGKRNIYPRLIAKKWIYSQDEIMWSKKSSE